MRDVRNFVFNEFENSDSVLVFHSEDSARYFLTEYVKKKGIPIKKDRALSFDTFKALFLAQRKERPVNMYHRKIYSNSVVERLKLNYLMNGKYPESAKKAKTFIEKCIPLLKRKEEFSPDIRKDFEIIYNDYIEFLKDNNLFEPAFENYEKKELDRDYILLFPSLIADNEEFSEFIRDNDRVRVINIDNFDQVFDKNLFSYPNSKAEVKYLMLKLDELKKKHVAVDDIIISTPDLQNLKPLLISEAKLYDIPLSFVPGETLDKTIPGVFFTRLENIYNSRFSFKSLEDFLLFPGFHFKVISLSEDFIKAMVDKKLNSGSIGSHDPILNSLYLDKNCKAIHAFYKKFKNDVIKIFTTRDSAFLNMAVYSFINNYLDEKPFDSENEFSFIMNEFETFLKAKAYLGIDVESPFSVFIESLKSRLYVRQNKKEGIRVYRFPQDALLDVPYHFVIGLSDELVRAEVKRTPPFEPYEIIKKDNENDNKVDDFFKLYQLGSANLDFSYSKETYSSQAIASEYFVKEGLEKESSSFKDPLFLPLLNNWKKETLKAPKILKTGLDYANSTFLVKGDIQDYTRLEKTNDRINGKIKLSYTSISKYDDCPFSYYLDKVLKVEEVSYSPKKLDNLQIGSKLHEICEKFFNIYPVLSGKDLKSCKAEMEKIFTRVLDDWKNESKALDKYTEFWMWSNYYDALQLLIDNTFESFMNTETFKTEYELNYEDTNGSYSFYGKIDRIMKTDSGSLIFVDYKKGNASDNKDSYQLPLYKIMYENSNPDTVIESLQYYGFKNNKYLEVKIDNKKIEDAKNALDDVIKGNNAGKWWAKPFYEEKSVCNNCPYKSICRRRFSVV